MTKYTLGIEHVVIFFIEHGEFLGWFAPCFTSDSMPWQNSILSFSMYQARKATWQNGVSELTML